MIVVQQGYAFQASSDTCKWVSEASAPHDERRRVKQSPPDGADLARHAVDLVRVLSVRVASVEQRRVDERLVAQDGHAGACKG